MRKPWGFFNILYDHLKYGAFHKLIGLESSKVIIIFKSDCFKREKNDIKSNLVSISVGLEFRYMVINDILEATGII